MSLSTLLANPIDTAVENMIPAVLYALLGLALYGVFWLIVVKISPFSIRKEIEDDQNTALGIVIGSVFIGLALIISAAIHG